MVQKPGRFVFNFLLLFRVDIGTAAPAFGFAGLGRVGVVRYRRTGFTADLFKSSAEIGLQYFNQVECFLVVLFVQQVCFDLIDQVVEDIVFFQVFQDRIGQLFLQLLHWPGKKALQRLNRSVDFGVFFEGVNIFIVNTVQPGDNLVQRFQKPGIIDDLIGIFGDHLFKGRQSVIDYAAERLLHPAVPEVAQQGVGIFQKQPGDLKNQLVDPFIVKQGDQGIVKKRDEGRIPKQILKIQGQLIDKEEQFFVTEVAGDNIAENKGQPVVPQRSHHQRVGVIPGNPFIGHNIVQNQPENLF